MNDPRPRPAPELGSRPPRVFISYRREDAAPYAGRLYDALVERFGESNVFMDVDTIGLGMDFTAAIERALGSCDAVVTLIGRNWFEARDGQGDRRLDDPEDLLRIELERALAGPALVVPTCVQGAGLPTEDALPPTLAPLARRQGIELRDDAWRDDVARLVRRLEQAVQPAEQRPPAAPPTRATRWARRGVTAAAGLVLATTAIAGVVMLKGGLAGGSRTGAPYRHLLGAIPQIVRSGCTSIDWGPESARASVSCSGTGVHTYYHLFASATLLEGWYVLAREAAGVRTDSGTCLPDSFFGESFYRIGGAVAGRYFCYFEGSEATLVWTDTEALVGAKANVWDGAGAPAAESLLTQWRCCFQPQN